MVPFNGIAQKAVLPFIVLSAIGWLLVVIGFGIGSNKYYRYTEPGQQYRYVPQPRNDPDMYLYWIVCLSGPFTFAAAVAHAALRKPFSPFVGAATSFLSAVFLTGLGMILYVNGKGIRYSHYYYHYDIHTYWKLEFAGAILATLFWTPVMILQRFYHDGFQAPSGYQELN